MLEYRIGSESHTSSWGKFYVKGLEQYQVKEDYESGKHESYTDYAAEVPPGIIFTVFSQAGNKRGTDSFDFYICETQPPSVTCCTIEGGHSRSSCKISGNFFILAHGEGKVKAPRLMNWWLALSQKCQAWYEKESGKLIPGTKKRYAAWCAKHLDTRGLKEIPDMPLDYHPDIPPQSISIE